MYYVQNDEMPSDEVMKAALGRDSIPKRTTRMPKKQNENNISGKITLSATSFAYKFLVTANDENCNATSLAYQWYRGNTLISGATSKYYTLGAEDIDQKITCVVSDATGKLKNSISATTPVIKKGSGPLAPVGLSMTPCTAGKSNGRIGHVTSDMEYATNEAFNNAKACPDGAVMNLAAGTYYVRYAETATNYAGYSEVITITEGLSDADLLISNKALRLQDTIAIDLRVPKSAMGSKYHDPYLVVKQGNAEKRLTEYGDDGTFLVFTYHTAPQMIGEDARIALYALNANDQTVAGEVIRYSVAQYCYNMLGKKDWQSEEYATFRRLLVDILLYGDAAQKYTDYNTDKLASHRLTKAQKAMGTDVNAAMTYNTVKKQDYKTISSSDALASIENAMLVLESVVNVRFKVNVNVKDPSELRMVITDNAECTNVIAKYPVGAHHISGDQYYVDVNRLNAGQMKKTIYATVMKGDKKVSNTYRYSIESYAASKKGSGDAKLDALLDSMMRYGDSAADYLAQY